ncbi:hypothetical protein GCM10010277_62870 [Streptomyces longisporoflavus]|nr:hypothetical protein GCM10010277_62870 [Streptomyces longisporoflavus]
MLLTVALIITAVLPAGTAGAAGEPVPKVGGGWPVGVRPAVVRGWEPPATEYGRGHRGVDLAAPPGAVVRAVAPGRVSFAGRVAGRGVIAVELTGTGDPPLRTTYGPVRATVEKGAEVVTGEALGVLELPPVPAHCPSSCLHWGLLRSDTYLDPLSLLPPWLLNRGAPRLLPVIDVPLLRLLPWWPATRPNATSRPGPDTRGPAPERHIDRSPGEGGLSPVRPAAPW